MQRLQKTFCVGGILGLCLSLAAPAQAQVIYVQSSNFRAVPVTQSFVQTRTIGSPRYSYGANYGSNYGYGYGSNYNYNYGYGYGYGSNSSYGQAWNNRTSGPAKWHENVYLPESNYVDAGVSNQSYVVSQPVMSSRVVSTRSFVAAQPRFVTQPVTTYQSVAASQPTVYSQQVYVSQPVASTRTFVMSQPVIPSEPIVISQPVRVYRSVAAAPQTIRTEAACPTTKRLESFEPTVSFSESSDGRRVKVYRYEYELDHRPGRVTIEFDSKD